MDDLWDIARVASYLGVSERTVYNKVRSGELPALRVGRLWRVRSSDFESWLAGQRRTEVESGRRVDVGKSPTRADLEALLEDLEDPVIRRIRFVGLLDQAIESKGLSAPVIVGGHAVQFYTAGDYPTVDIDLAGDSESVGGILDAWGFEREGRHWYDQSLNLLVEVPGGHLSPAQMDHVVSVRSGGVTAYVLGIEDLITDRLAACAFWNDEESCRWARVLLEGATELDDAYLRKRAAEEGLQDRLAGLRRETE